MSGVADDYLCQELIRQGGYDILPKPLRADNAARVVKLALSYWNSSKLPFRADVVGRFISATIHGQRSGDDAFSHGVQDQFGEAVQI